MTMSKEQPHKIIWLDMSAPPIEKKKIPLVEYEVWVEGFTATGESGQAHLWGKVKARSFKEACHRIACQNYLKNIEEQEMGLGRWDYNPNRQTLWACRLFETEAEARESFG